MVQLLPSLQSPYYCGGTSNSSDPPPPLLRLLSQRRPDLQEEQNGGPNGADKVDRQFRERESGRRISFYGSRSKILGDINSLLYSWWKHRKEVEGGRPH